MAAQCGGEGNIALTLAAAEQVIVEDRFEEFFTDWEETWYFADPGTTRARLEDVGFEGIETWLHDEHTEFGSVEELSRFLKTAVLRPHLAVLPPARREPFAAAVAERIAERGRLVVDYVRLNMLAARPESA